MPHDLEIFLFGELRVVVGGVPMPLPASRKTRALLAYLVATDRPHRRERLCGLLWDLPDDPKAALRWALSKLRKVVDSGNRQRIVADRERAGFDRAGVAVDLHDIHARLRDTGDIDELEAMAGRLELILLDGLEGAGDDTFDAWLAAEREDAAVLRVSVVQKLATHARSSAASAQKWMRLWHSLDSAGAAAYAQQVEAEQSPAAPGTGRRIKKLGAGRTAPAPRINPKGRALRAQRIGFCEARDGTKIAFATMGAGPPLLKAANWLNHLEFDWDSPIWGKTFATIARTRTFARYDERGCGLSDWNVADLSFEKFVEDLEAVADKLELDRFPLLGISQGCAVSIEYAVRHPERVTGLVLIGGYAAGWRISATLDEQARREAVRQLTEVGWGTDNPAYRHIFSQTFMPEAGPDRLAWFDEFQRLTTSPRNAARFQDAFGYIDVRHRLAQVNVPTIVLHSKYDQRIPLEQGRELASSIPNARFVPLESRNHILLDDEPAWRACVDAVAQFMAETGI